MIDLDLALSVLKEGLKLWNNKEANKYVDRIIKLEKDYNDEMGKPTDERNDYLVDSILLELRILAQSFVHYPAKNRSP